MIPIGKLVLSALSLKNLSSSQKKVITKNVEFVNFISQPLAQINRQFFKEKIGSLEQWRQEMIVEIDEEQKPIKDEYGRSTYFYCFLGDKVIPIYQPGSLMFETAVGSANKLAVYSNNAQQNGGILGNGCALFLIKFTTNLIQIYNQLCQKSKLDIKKLHEEVYVVAMKENLLTMAKEDMEEHGRLLLIKDQLLDVVKDQEQRQKQKLEQLFYMKDIVVQRSQSMTAQQVYDQQIDLESIKQERNQNLIFNQNQIDDGKLLICKQIDQIKDMLMNKQGIVHIDYQDEMRNQLDMILNDSVVNNLKRMTIDEQDCSDNNQAISMVKDQDELYQSQYLDQSKTSQKDVKEDQKMADQQNKVSDQQNADNQLRYQVVYINNLFRNEKLYYYFHSVNETVHQFLVDSQLSDCDVTNIYKENQCLELLKVFDEIIPDFELQSLKMNQAEVNDRIKNISRLFDKNRRAQFSKLIATQLMIKKRDYLNRLDHSILAKYYNCQLCYKKMFKNKDPITIQIQLDIKQIEMGLISMDQQWLDKLVQYKSDHGLVQDLTEMLVEQCIKNMKMKDISPNLKQDELPAIFKFKDKLNLSPYYFKNPIFCLPLMLKRLASESEQKYENRVYQFLRLMSKDDFIALAELFDYNDQDQQVFIRLYQRVKAETPSKKDSKKCSIF